MAIGKGLKSFVDAFMKAQELKNKQQFYALQLEYMRRNNERGSGKDKDTTGSTAAEENAKAKGYGAGLYGGAREGRSVGTMVSDPADKDLAPHQRAALNAIAAPESGGEYDRLYAGPNAPPTYFEGYDQHPDMGAPGPAGWSTAAGRYQFTKSTWNDMGGGSFEPVNQDRKAWALAQRDYSIRTDGRDLDADIRKNGFTPEIARVLSPTWTGLKANPDQAIATYNDSMRRYKETQNNQVAEGALPVGGTTTPALSAAPVPPPRLDNLGQALPTEAGATAPTPTAYYDPQYEGALPVTYAGYDPQYSEAVYAAKGGLVPDFRQNNFRRTRPVPVQRFQYGGDVLSEDDAGDTIDPYAYSALDTGGAGDIGGIPTRAPRLAPTQSQAQGGAPDNPIHALLSSATDAVTDGVKWLADRFGISGALPGNIAGHAGVQALSRNEGAASKEDVDEADDAVDPDKHMQVGARRLAGMNASYQYYLAHGDTAKSKAVAGSMLMYAKQIADESATMALRDPDLISAAKTLAKGHNQIPGADQFTVDDRGNYVIRDAATGRPINAGVVSPQQLLGAARGMKDGTVFWQTLAKYAKPDEAEETVAEKKQRMREEATDAAVKTLGLPGASAGGGAIPTAPVATGADTSAAPAAPPDTSADTGEKEGRSAGAGTPPKAGMKPAVAAATAQLPATFEETLDTPEKVKAYTDMIKANPAAAQLYQNRHALRVQQQAEAQAATARANAPDAPPKEAAYNQSKVADEIDSGWTDREEKLKGTKVDIVAPDGTKSSVDYKSPPPKTESQIKSLARDIAKADPNKRTGQDGLESALNLAGASFGMKGDKIPTAEDGKQPNYKAAERMLPYEHDKDRNGPFIRFKEDGTTVRLSGEGKLKLNKLERDKAFAQWTAEKEGSAGPAKGSGVMSSLKGLDDATEALMNSANKGIAGMARGVAGRATREGQAWWERTAPYVPKVPQIPQDLPGIPQLAARGVSAIPPGPSVIPRQAIFGRVPPRAVPVAPPPPGMQGVPIPQNVPMPDWSNPYP